MSPEQPNDKAESPQGETPQAETAAELPRRRTGQWKSGVLIGLLFALLGGVLAWAVNQAVYPVFVAPEKYGQSMAGVPESIQKPLDRKNAMFALALIGGLTAAGLAAGESLCRRSWKLALVSGILCGVIGGAFGCLAGYLGHAAFEYCRPRQELSELARTLLVQGGMLATVGCGVGLSVGAVLGRRPRVLANCLGAGLLGGLLAGLLYVIAAVGLSLVMPVITDTLIPIRWGERLLWAGLAAALLGLLIPAMAGGHRCNPADASGSAADA